MKLRITSQDISRLSPEQAQTLRGWWEPQEGDYLCVNDHEEMVYFLNGINRAKAVPLLTIGQMLKLLDEKAALQSIEQIGGVWNVNRRYADTELCDALWQALEAVL